MLFRFLAAKTISLDEGFVLVGYLPNVVAKRSQRTLSLGISLTTHPSLVFLTVYSSKKPLRNHLPLPYGRGFTFVLQQHEAEWLAETLCFVEMERMILYRKNVWGTVWSLHCCKIFWLEDSARSGRIFLSRLLK